jgi:hypothetical protein
MNVLELGRRFDFRKIESKPLPSKAETAAQRQNEFQTSLTLASASVKLSPAAISPQGNDHSTSRADGETLDEVTEAFEDESIAEDSTDWPDDPGDVASDRELAEEPSEKEDDEAAEEQRRRKTWRLDRLEACYRSRFIVLSGLLDRLATAQALLTHHMDKHGVNPESTDPISPQ